MRAPPGWATNRLLMVRTNIKGEDSSELKLADSPDLLTIHQLLVKHNSRHARDKDNLSTIFALSRKGVFIVALEHVGMDRYVLLHLVSSTHRSGETNTVLVRGLGLVHGGISTRN